MWGSLFKSVIVICLFFSCGRAYSQDSISWYNTDSLLASISNKPYIKKVLATAEEIYQTAGIDSSNISPAAFKVAYLQREWMAKHGPRVHIHHKKRHILSIADMTKKSNAKRFITVDLAARKILFDTLVAQGAGKLPNKNDKYIIPTFFSNVVNSECTSLGMAVATAGTRPCNPCHLCRFSPTATHHCAVIMEGLEPGINNNMKRRDIVLHTTGSGSGLHQQMPAVADQNYMVDTTGCWCYRTDANQKIKATAAYASDCGIIENDGYIGQSNGCLVLPEEHHIAQMAAIEGHTLIFTYSNVISPGTHYFRYSPIIRSIVKYAGGKHR